MVYVARLSQVQEHRLSGCFTFKKRNISQQLRLAPGVKIFQAMPDQGETIFCLVVLFYIHRTGLRSPDTEASGKEGKRKKELC